MGGRSQPIPPGARVKHTLCKRPLGVKRPVGPQAPPSYPIQPWGPAPPPSYYPSGYPAQPWGPTPQPGYPTSYPTQPWGQTPPSGYSASPWGPAPPPGRLPPLPQRKEQVYPYVFGPPPWRMPAVPMQPLPLQKERPAWADHLVEVHPLPPWDPAARHPEHWVVSAPPPVAWWRRCFGCCLAPRVVLERR